MKKTTVQIILSLTFSVSLSSAKLGAPVSFGLASADELVVGQPAEVLVVLTAGADISLARFDLGNSTDWQVIDGLRFWQGSLSRGEVKQLTFRAIPLTTAPKPLRGTVKVPGYDEQVALLDPNRMGGRFPERGEETEEQARQRQSEIQIDEIRAQVHKDPDATEPLPAREPRIPGMPEIKVGADRQARQETRAAAVNVTGTGRFTYFDHNNIRQPVRFATVELFDQNPAPSFGDALCGTGTTDVDGNFSVSGNCGDLTDGPDLFARIVLNNTRIEIKPNDVFSGSYTFKTGVASNRPPGTHNFGTITIAEPLKAPFALHNLVTRAQRFMAARGEVMSKVTVNFPITGWPHYNSFFHSLNIPVTFDSNPDDETPARDPIFRDVGTVFHEYAHHILHTKAESPAPDYSREHEGCDASHCSDMPENLNVAWTEGFPNFYAFLIHTDFRASDGYPTTTNKACETVSIDSSFAGEEDQIEDVVCAILWDLSDAENDDDGLRGAGRRDNINLSFGDIWQVVKSFDPSTSAFHNHPTTIHEFWSGMRLFQLSNINRISEVFREHNINKPQPDLRITTLQNAPSSVNRGAAFTVSNTVRNMGDELANSAFAVRFELTAGIGRDLRAYQVGSRSITASFPAGGTNAANTSLTVPEMPAGVYTLRACADSRSEVPESNEGNNCRSLATPMTVQ